MLVFGNALEQNNRTCRTVPILTNLFTSLQGNKSMTSKRLFGLIAAASLIMPATGMAQSLNYDFNSINQDLAKEGLMIQSIEWITSEDSEQVGRTVFFTNRGNKQLSAHYVPGDPRRGGFSDITYIVDMVDGATAGGLTAVDTQGAIDNAMATWDEVTCSAIPVTNLGGLNVDLGYIQASLGYGGVFGWAADLTHAGWLPAGFFDAIAPNGSNFILGVTFTLIWTDSGVPTDIDNNGRDDVAFREIYYNDNFQWAVDGGGVDIETVALHEAGHGLSQGHFGSASRTKNGKVHFSPRAVMNATYSGIQRDIRKTDNGGHCSNWASWPNN